MRTFIVYESEVEGDQTMKMYLKSDLLQLIRDLEITDEKFKTEDAAIENISSVEGGWNGDGDCFWMIGEIVMNAYGDVEWKLLIQ